MDYDVLIAGAGPAGTTAGTLLAREGRRVLIADKATFPRDKTCGDAISGKSVDALKALGLIDQMQDGPTIDSWGILFSSAAGDEVAIPFTKDYSKPVPPGYLATRVDFDNLLLETAVESGCTVWQNTAVTGLVRNGEAVTGMTVKRDGEVHTLNAPLVLGADGAYSVVARELGMTQLDEDHYYASVRGYYEGVTGFLDHHFIELHFVEEAAPGYFWIFPMPDGKANVGLVVLSRTVKQKGLKLKRLLADMIAHPRFAARFANARPLGTPKGWGLPLASKPKPMAGDGWMLLGDAASLIDPFTGEGIGNAMVSGMHAAQWAGKALDTGDASKALLSGYEADVLAVLKDEIRISTTLQRMLRWKWLFNTVIRKASRSDELADTISCMFDDLGARSRLTSPMFYLRLMMA
ncbi:MAG: NAD(P)/FAD-dependent oxidoreductase [Bacteroidota bacterium]